MVKLILSLLTLLSLTKFANAETKYVLNLGTVDYDRLASELKKEFKLDQNNDLQVTNLRWSINPIDYTSYLFYIGSKRYLTLNFVTNNHEFKCSAVAGEDIIPLYNNTGRHIGYGYDDLLVVDDCKSTTARLRVENVSIRLENFLLAEETDPSHNLPFVD